jgi:hypothetical protein
MNVEGDGLAHSTVHGIRRADNPPPGGVKAKGNQALGALMAEIHRSERAMKVLAAMAVQALDFAHLSADRLGGDVQWLDDGPGHRRLSGTKPNSARITFRVPDR